MLRKTWLQVIQLSDRIRHQVTDKPIVSLFFAIIVIWLIWTIRTTYKANNLGFDKTLWDWMDLLIVPAVLALGVVLLNRSQRNYELKIAEKNRETDKQIALNRQYQNTLETYLDHMTEFIIEKGLGTDHEIVGVQSIARIRTLNVLRTLDAKRVSLVFQFINDADLQEIVTLSSGNLKNVDWAGSELWRTNLKEIDLRGANLSKAILSNADLRKANLQKADLSLSDLSSANLSEAFLMDANLRGAYLFQAKLFQADLARADLRGANLGGALLDEANLGGADLRGTHLAISNPRNTIFRGAIYDENTYWFDDCDIQWAQRKLGAQLKE